jgi:outer membrane lipoprotein SlyB
MSKITPFTATFLRSAAFGVGCALFLSGCAGLDAPSSSVAASTQSNYYPGCYQPVADLRSSDAALKKSVTTGAIAGGLLGAVAGAVAGDSDDRTRNALIGAAGGALVGGVAGYYKERQNQIADDHQRIASYGADFDRAAGELDRNVSYAKAAQSCYQREFSALRDAHKTGNLSESEGRARLAEIVSGLQETNALLAKADGRAGENVATYTQAYQQDLDQVGVQRQAVAQAAAAEAQSKPVPAVARSVPKEAVATERKIQQVQAKRAESQEVASRGRSMVSDVCNNPDMGDWAPASCKA